MNDLMNTTAVSDALLTPPMPVMANDDISGLGVLRAIRRNAFEAFPKRCWQEPVLRLDTPFRPVVIASSPDAIRHVMLDYHPDYVRPSAGKRVMGPIVGKGLPVSEGAAWRSQRRAMAPAFTLQKIQMLTELIRDVSERACVELEGKRAEPTDLLDFFKSVSLDIGATVMFSTDVSAIGAELGRQLTFYVTRIGSPSPLDFLLPSWMPTVLAVRRAIFRRSWRKLLANAIAERRARDKTASLQMDVDLFDLLEQAYGNRSDNLLADEVSTMLVAGYETAALTLFWTSVLLAHAPHIQTKVAAEAATLNWAVSDGLKLSELPLTKAVVQEALRLYSPIPITARLAVRTHSICGLEVPAGAMVLIPFWMSHRDPERWASPAGFSPWRFLSGPAPGRFDYLPFGIGPHVCIGAQLALTEATIVLARLLRDNQIEPMQSGIPLPVGRLSTRPSFSPLFSVTARRYQNPQP